MSNYDMHATKRGAKCPMLIIKLSNVVNEWVLKSHLKHGNMNCQSHDHDDEHMKPNVDCVL